MEYNSLVDFAESRTLPIGVVVGEERALVRPWKNNEAAISLVDMLQSSP